MATNIELKIAALERRISELEKSGLKTGEAINQVQFEETTKKTGDLLRESYDAINKEKQEAIKNKASRETFDKLAELKKQVPTKYAISKESMKELNDILNSLRSNQSVTFK